MSKSNSSKSGFAFVAVVSLIGALMMTSVASAETLEFWDEFNGEFQGGSLVDSPPESNTGYNDETGINGSPWYQYDNGWINQWYFNADEISGSKDIWWDLQIGSSLNPPPPVDTSWELFDEIPAVVDVAINWSERSWNDVGGGTAPPLPGDTEGNNFIQRFIVFQDEELYAGQPLVDSTTDPGSGGTGIHIPDFNPQWVSIDVRIDFPGIQVWQTGNQFAQTEPLVRLEGMVHHRHNAVPQPTTLASLLSLGAFGALGLRWRRKTEV